MNGVAPVFRPARWRAEALPLQETAALKRGSTKIKMRRGMKPPLNTEKEN
jgi:hypothetical protein